MSSLTSPPPSPPFASTFAPPPSRLPNILRDIGEDDIAILTFDHPDSSANIFDDTTLDDLNSHLVELDSLGVRGLVIVSAKPTIFIAGADLGSIEGLTKAALNTFIHKGQTVFELLAGLKIPTAAAIHGACMGGGLELALACDWRVASSDRVTTLGLPETQLGILPAWGGCTRLPKLIGLNNALGLILSGKRLSPGKAKKLGVVDAVVEREQLLIKARALLARGKRDFEPHRLTNNRVSAGAVRYFVGRKLQRQTRGNYPAPLEALGVTTASVSIPVSRSLENERSALLRLAETAPCRNLIRTFNLQQRSRRMRFDRTVKAKPENIERVAVIGAGVMGAGIAQWVSSRGLPVILQDIDESKIATGLSSIRKLYAGAVKRRIFNLREATRRMDLVHGTASRVPLTNEDLVIEAAVENLEIKKKIFVDLSKRTRPDAILATNTSALPITELVETPGIVNPERILGLHFFNPVHRMKLVEIVVTKRTSPEAVEATLRFVKSIGKLPVIVNDSPGFVVNRILMPYLLMAGKLFDRGIDGRLIDDAMLDFGMPMGPLRLLDEIGLDVALHVAKTLGNVPPIPSRLVESGQFGRKAGTGFYNYPKPGKPTLSRDALDIRNEDESFVMSAAKIIDLLSILMVDEAARCLEEGVAGAPEDIDFAMIMGTGWAPFRGGPLRFADSVGHEQLLARFKIACEAAQENCEPSERLQTGGKFYKNP
ncbi:MAG: 3-hydroxyacyl-CoA dehydrogenase/enoyl-CoA hydratase/3-hydroxybutyryl-CoA epimerase [Verrucomicrobiales bacterium]|jgi:3-hydroxyacyl-CoA dehydrogenase/enoyl-CoA hydratase/3-hydroxybutyryl-CoA epimerase